MNARLCERLDTWYRPEPFSRFRLYSDIALSGQEQPNNTQGRGQDGDEE